MRGVEAGEPPTGGIHRGRGGWRGERPNEPRSLTVDEETRRGGSWGERLGGTRNGGGTGSLGRRVAERLHGAYW